ncbi:hypothetical protein F1559_003274 [Cyanidiococcus yangmingshanensis]|uniref:Signal recognition particle subunit SRP68 n=1 Tax=Cyanidiococcus yangmingshanensis TaxID=2690220 RepID=A0A7J7IKG1_9RHOD|nr:hypothetical protein F1559_003274 [Cyanidiococcus yangmingshanensis]
MARHKSSDQRRHAGASAAAAETSVETRSKHQGRRRTRSQRRRGTLAPVPALRKAKNLAPGSQTGSETIPFGPWAMLWHLQQLQERHGGDLGDLRGYATYCSKRLRSLRVRVAYTCSVSRRSSQYARARIDSKILREHAAGDRRFLEIGVLEAERAWAQAMDAKDQLMATVSRLGSVSEGNWSVSTELPSLSGAKQRRAHRLRRYFLRRLHRAAGLAERMLYAAVAARNCFAAWTIVELYAYTCWLWGLYLLEHGQAWSEALDLLQLARRFYQTLGDCIPLEANIASIHIRKIHQTYSLRVSDLDRLVQVSEREAGRLGAKDTKRSLTIWKRLDQVLVQRLLEQLHATKTCSNGIPDVMFGGKRPNQVPSKLSTPQTISWCGHTITVPSVPIESLLSRKQSVPSTSSSVSTSPAGSSQSLVELLAQAEHYKGRRMPKAIRIFDVILSHLDALLAEQPTDDDLRLFVAFWRYRKALALLQSCVQREKYDEALIWVQEIGDLFGISESLHETTEAVTTFLRARQAMHLAQFYWERFLGTERDVARDDALFMQLLARVYAFATQVLQLESSLLNGMSTSPQDSVRECTELMNVSLMDTETIRHILKEARGLKVRASAHFALEEEHMAEHLERATMLDAAGSLPKRYMQEHLTEYVTPDEIVRLPPALRPMTCKPFVLDLAFQEVRYPALPQARNERRGLLNRWFGR